MNPFKPLLTLLLALPLLSTPGLEPVTGFGPNREGGRAGRIYMPAQPDGRIVLMIREAAAPHEPPGPELIGEVRRMVEAGCAVALLQIEPRNGVLRFNDFLHERVWRGVIHDLRGRMPRVRERLILLPPGHVLLDPVPFFEYRRETLFLDISVPSARRPFPGYLRVNSGAFGLDLPMYLADQGFAIAHVPDPFAELNLTRDESIRMIRAAAKTFREQARPHGHQGGLGLGGRSKHGMAAAVMGAGGTHADVPPEERVQVVIAMTDTLHPPTRHEDFVAAGHRSDGPADPNEDRGSPVTLLNPGAPAFYLCDAHGRRSRQVDRMIDALTSNRVPFAQGWGEDLPNFIRKHPDEIMRFLRDRL